MTTTDRMPIRLRLAYDIAERAKDASDLHVMRAAYRCIEAWRLGRKAGADWVLVRAFAHE